MRTFEIPGMAGVQLIDRSDVSEFYDIGTEVLTYASTEELLEHAHRLQRDQRWAQEIGRRGRQRTLAEHTFDHRVADLEDLWR